LVAPFGSVVIVLLVVVFVAAVPLVAVAMRAGLVGRLVFGVIPVRPLGRLVAIGRFAGRFVGVVGVVVQSEAGCSGGGGRAMAGRGEQRRSGP
jgi:hypothetical protein